MRRFLLMVLGVVAGVQLYKELPALKRYVKMERM